MSQAELFKDEKDTTEVFCCPICGSTELAVDVISTAVQQPDGTWEFKPIDQADLEWEATNVNTGVRCLNDTCGNPILPNGEELDTTRQSIFEYWLGINGLPASHSDLSPEEEEKWNAFLADVRYHPFEGVIGDCKKLSM